MPTVAGPVEGSGTPMGLGITLGPIFQQELAYGIVPIAAGVVLQVTETDVKTAEPGKRQGWGVERIGALEREA